MQPGLTKVSTPYIFELFLSKQQLLRLWIDSHTFDTSRDLYQLPHKTTTINSSSHHYYIISFAQSLENYAFPTENLQHTQRQT
jgi:hypothetical protein